MRKPLLSAALAAALTSGLTTVSTQAADGGAGAAIEAAAVRELLYGPKGRQEGWTSVPELVVLASVMQFAGTDATAGYTATEERLSAEEARELAADLEEALGELTGGMMTRFAAVRVEDVPAGGIATAFRRGQIVAGRYRDVQKQTGTVGYGGRATRSSVITAAAVFLDRDFDREPGRRKLLRTHELGHALGYNHVESERSVMNPRVGSGITDFDRRVIRIAFPSPPEGFPLAAASPSTAARDTRAVEDDGHAGVGIAQN
jgi:hypothetical protein